MLKPPSISPYRKSRREKAFKQIKEGLDMLNVEYRNQQITDDATIVEISEIQSRLAYLAKQIRKSK